MCGRQPAGSVQAGHPGSRASGSPTLWACLWGRAVLPQHRHRQDLSSYRRAAPMGRAIVPDGADCAGSGHSSVMETSSSGCSLAEHSGFACRHSNQPTSQPAQDWGPVPVPGGRDAAASLATGWHWWASAEPGAQVSTRGDCPGGLRLAQPSSPRHPPPGTTLHRGRWETLRVAASCFKPFALWSCPNYY